jgi:hypothetical protein
MTADPQEVRGRRSRPASPSAVAKLPAGATPDARKAAIVAVIERTGLHPLHSARSVGVSAASYYRYVDGDPEFRDQIDAATSLFARRMAAVVATAAASLHSWKAAAWWLERRLPDLYGPRLDLRVAEQAPEQELEDHTTEAERAARLRLLVEEAQRRLEPADRR